MNNARLSESRNKREGWFRGKYKHRVYFEDIGLYPKVRVPRQYSLRGEKS